MATTQQDTEITLGTGRMLAIFFGLVVVCACFFALGFSLGRKTAMAGVTIHSPASAPATVVRPSASKNDAAPSGPQPDDFSFYKSVGDKKADSALSAPEKRPTPPAAAVPSEPPKSTDASAPATSGGYFVQVAAVTRKEDADSLVEALNKKQYPAFAASKTNTDKYYRVQVGPYFELKEAETMKARLVADGYNPIVKK